MVLVKIVMKFHMNFDFINWIDTKTQEKGEVF